jgi:hypothetical protein
VADQHDRNSLMPSRGDEHSTSNVRVRMFAQLPTGMPSTVLVDTQPSSFRLFGYRVIWSYGGKYVVLALADWHLILGSSEAE